MKANEAWQMLISESKDKPILLKTKKGLNFSLISKGDVLIVNSSNIEPASKLKMPRPIFKVNFEKVFPYYSRWKNGEQGLSKEVTAITVNSVYIMAAIDFLVKNKNN